MRGTSQAGIKKQSWPNKFIHRLYWIWSRDKIKMQESGGSEAAAAACVPVFCAQRGGGGRRDPHGTACMSHYAVSWCRAGPVALLIKASLSRVSDIILTFSGLLSALCRTAKNCPWIELTEVIGNISSDCQMIWDWKRPSLSLSWLYCGFSCCLTSALLFCCISLLFFILI